MDGFLEEHSSEALVVRVKDEGYPLGNNQLTFAEAFDRDIKNTRRIRPFDARHPLPSLGELRGSIFLLQEFKSSHLYGLEWDGTHMTLEDWWIVPDLSFLPIKWDKIRAALELAATKPLDNSSLYLAHVSATGERLMPVNAAAGPTDRSVGGLNDRTGHWLEDQCGAFPQPRVGIVIMDFPGWRAIDAVLAWNEALRQSRGVDDLEQRCLLKRDV
ncbi:hypothetical protein XA68_12487 [Ophiocordyceps unilateralis]|uniref:Uncharacterized protein n=1 Tax=Ophiocordyceps unilateralis TaxID=268505 RepID=A0A2A9PCV0_OPHUN|nr:hypothetical protein XA68_12487 [Ophiocordyceps unilateralis]